MLIDPQTERQDLEKLLLDVVTRLDRIEKSLASPSASIAKEWYTVAEVAEILEKAPFTVREWCRNSRINADKRHTGRGRSLEWMISHSELERISNKGLLPN